MVKIDHAVGAISAMCEAISGQLYIMRKQLEEITRMLEKREDEKED